MTWQRAAIAVCAVVAGLAGAVSVAADAVAADHDPPHLAASPPRSSPITLDTVTRSCPSPPDAAPAELPQTSCEVQVRLPVGASEQDVIGALGQPQRRRTLGADGETWDYDWQSSGEALQESAYATLRFDEHRLVDAVEYIFK